MEDYDKILSQLANGNLKEYEVDSTQAFEFQKKLRNFAKRQNIIGEAQRGGKIIYRQNKNDD